MRLRYLAAAGLLLVPGAAQAARHELDALAPRPNIVVVWTDDQTLEEMRFLPKTQALIGREGVTFTNYFDSFSLCCPARATFLTGQYSHSNGVEGNMLPNGGYYKLDSTRTLPVWLQRAGYYTALVGKYLNQYGTRNQTEVPPGWSEWHGAVDPTTYRYFNYTLNENGRLQTYCASPAAGCYSTDVYAQKAVDVIRRVAPSTKPFFLWVTPLAPHSGQPRDPDDPANLATPSPAPRYANRYAEEPLPMPPSFNEADVADKPRGIRNRALLGPVRINAIRESYQQRAESLLAVDDMVEQIVAALRASGELGKTLLMFSSDNGFFHGEHRVPNGKVLLYEPSIHLPLLMRGPGVPRGQKRTQLAVSADWAPTILAAARASASGRVLDGTSLWPLIRDRGKELGRDLVLENGPGAANSFKGLRTLHYKYAEYANGDRELYDLVRDPYELTNVASDSRYAATSVILATRLTRLRNCHGAACRERQDARLSVSARRGPRCSRSPLVLEVRGVGIERVVFQADGRSRATDARAPFRATLRVGRGRMLFRARVSSVGDRLVTVDRSLRICAR
ncbi:MAG: sulfatase [Gaiellaceae bacterium]